MRSRVPQHQVAQRIGDWLGEGVGHARRQRDAERVSQPAGVLDCAPTARWPAMRSSSTRRCAASPASQTGRLRRVGGPLRCFGRGQRAERAQHVGNGLSVPADAARRQPLQLPLGFLDHQRIEQLAQLGLAEQLGQQRRVECERLGAPLG